MKWNTSTTSTIRESTKYVESASCFLNTCTVDNNCDSSVIAFHSFVLVHVVVFLLSFFLYAFAHALYIPT